VQKAYENRYIRSGWDGRADAAAFTIATITAYIAWFGAATPGRRNFLFTAGGTGFAAIQLARRWPTVITTAGGASKAAPARFWAPTMRSIQPVLIGLRR